MPKQTLKIKDPSIQVEVVDLYQDATHTFEGNPKECVKQILKEFPWIESELGPYPDLDLVLKQLNRNQAHFAKILNPLKKSEQQTFLPDIQMPYSTYGGGSEYVDSRLSAYLAAARFLSSRSASKEEIREALLEFEGDPIAVALAAYKLPVTSRDDIVAVVYVSNLGRFRKSIEGFKKIEATNDESKEFANIAREANDTGKIKEAPFVPGEHSKGMLISTGSKGGALILKPGSGSVDKHTGATQSQHEAAFYDVACAWGLGKYVPEARLILIDGQEYAAIRMLDPAFKNMNDLRYSDPDLPVKAFAGYQDGTLQRWGTLDYVTGQGDRHCGNLMCSGSDVRLIDHGSAFAKEPFIVGKQFTPYYLRATIQGYSKLSPEDKFAKLPRLEGETLDAFSDWLMELSPEILGLILGKYGIARTPSMERLRLLQSACHYMEASAALAMAWSGI